MTDEYKFLTFKEHVNERASTWGGTNVISSEAVWLVKDDKFVKEKTNLSDGLCKIFDEILTNATDQYVRSAEFKEDKVTEIRVNYNNKSGEITITNNGKGIGIYKHQSLQGRYSVEGLITKEYGGSNFTDKEDPDRVTGGMNGVGMKLVNIYSVYFAVETIDTINKLYYHQVCRDNMDKVEEPTVLPLDKVPADKAYPHTSFTFIPDYSRLCLVSKTDTCNPNWLTKDNLEQFGHFVKLRTYQTAMFVSQIDYRYKGSKRLDYLKKCQVYYNDVLISKKTLADYMKMFGIENCLEFSLSHTLDQATVLECENKAEQIIRFPWYICIGLNTKNIPDKGMSMVNGVYMKKGGHHITVLLKLFKDHLSSFLADTMKGRSVIFNEKMLAKCLYILDCRHIPIPDFSGGNIKDSIQLGSKEKTHMSKLYQIPDSIVEKLWKLIGDTLKYLIFAEDLNKSTKKRRNKHIRKYEEAPAVTKKSSINRLIIPEGDSAAKPIRDIIMSKKTPIKRENYGIYNIQGVPPNACKQSRPVIINGREHILQDLSLQENISFRGLVDALELDFLCDYFYGNKDLESWMREKGFSERKKAELRRKREKGDADFAKLPYRGGIIIATDQDVDGIGNICSLIMVFILRFWPELIKRGFVSRLQTPIIRVYQKNTVLNFYSEKNFRDWVSKKFGSMDKLPQGYEVRYYKGLSGHTPEEVIEDIGMNFNNNILKIIWDKDVMTNMKIYYGQETEDRKKALLTPVDKEYPEDLPRTLTVPASLHFEIETKTFQLEFMHRKLKHCMDNFIPSQRKAFAGARIKFRKEGKIKVYQLTGFVTNKMHYQHGEASMNQTITKMGQLFTGTNNIPPFVGISNGFGDRVLGRGKTGSPRYIDIKYNSKVMNLMFPPEDDWLLEYNYEDGKQCEPKYYVPIVPYSILESSTTTGAGWQIKVWARDFNWVLLNLRNMIKYDYPKINSEGKIIGEPYSMLGKVWLPKGMRVVYGLPPHSTEPNEICLGTYYELDDKGVEKVVVTQLPLKIWSRAFKCSLLGLCPKTEKKKEDKDGNEYPAKDLVTHVLDETGNDENHIIITFKPGSLAKIKEEYGNNVIDPIEEYLGLYQILNPQINMIGKEGNIVEFRSYEDVMKCWFLERKRLYQERLARKIALLELRIRFNEEIIRFILLENSGKINIDVELEEEERTSILEKHNFIKFNKRLLFQPEYLKLSEINRIYDEGTYTYIDDITVRMKSKKSLSELQTETQKKKDELRSLREKTWQTLWLEELDELEKVVRLGSSTGWQYTTKKHQFTKPT